jgi:predicted ArsR family transcriptional regulator
MGSLPWIDRLLSSTRGQILELLRRSGRTVSDLAEALGVTENAVRSQLSGLEKDGLVRQETVARKGVGKPAYVYSLSPAADALLPKAYAPVLSLLLGVLSERMGAEEVEGVLREVGRRAAAGRPVAGEGLRERVDAAVKVLGELGGVAEVEESEESIHIRGFSCPLAALVPGNPQVCRLAETLVSEVVGAPVWERCDKGARPRCCFEIARNAG